MFRYDITKPGLPGFVISKQNISCVNMYHNTIVAQLVSFTHPTRNLQDHLSCYQIYVVSVFHFESEKCWRDPDSTES